MLYRRSSTAMTLPVLTHRFKAASKLASDALYIYVTGAYGPEMAFTRCFENNATADEIN